MIKEFLLNVLNATVQEIGKKLTPIGRAIRLVGRFFGNNWIYIVWFLFYLLLFGVLTRGIALLFYLATIPLAFSELAEDIWRAVSGVRPLRLKSEKERLLPLFKDVYQGAVKANPNLARDIKLYIKEDMTINAFAFGKTTLVITRGSIELLSDDCLKGLMAHEFGHFSYRHTEALLLSMVGNLPMTLINRKLSDIKNRLNTSGNRRTLITGIFIIFFDFVYYIFRALEFIGELLLMRSSRKHEYIADGFAVRSGFGKELTDVLIEVYSVSISKPESVREQLRSTHPHITLRIEELEVANH